MKTLLKIKISGLICRLLTCAHAFTPVEAVVSAHEYSWNKYTP